MSVRSKSRARLHPSVRLTLSRRENGRHSWKVPFERKLLKNVGQVWLVKFLPRLVSNGAGSAALL